LPANQIGCKYRQLIVLVIRPAVFDCHILAFDKAGLAEALPECIDAIGVQIVGCRWTEKSDHRHRRLLRTRGARPNNRRGRHAGKKRDKLASFHGLPARAEDCAIYVWQNNVLKRGLCHVSQCATCVGQISVA